MGIDFAGQPAIIPAPPPPPSLQAEGVDARILAALLTGVRRAVPFLPPPVADALAAKHADALFKLAATAAFGTGVQALALLLQLADARSAVSDRLYRSVYARLADPAAPRSSKAPQFLSLVFRAVRADPSRARAAAFVKRLLQGAAVAPPQYAAAALLLVSELARGAGRRHLWGLITQPEEREEEAAEQGERAREGETSDGDDGGDDDDDAKPAAAPPPPSTTTAYPCGYDPAKREPRGAHADAAGLWELLPLAAHAHPSVAAFARSLLAGTPIEYAGDPLRDFAAVVALDKFLAKKPKDKTEGDRTRAPPYAASAAAAKSARPHPGSAEFAALAAADVAPDERYLHAWHAERAANTARARGGRGAADADADASDSDDEDDRVDAFLAGEEEGGGGGVEGGDADAGGDYSQLAAALADDVTTRAARGGGGEGSSEDGASGSEEEEDEASEEGGESDDDSDASAELGTSALASLGGLHPNDLPSASGSSLPTDDSDSGSGSDGGEGGGWTLAPAARRPPKRASRGAGSAFASADDYADLLAADAAGEDVTAAAAARAEAAGVVVRRRKRARRG